DEPRSLATRYGFAIAAHLAGDSRKGLSGIDALIKKKPRDPYLHEMRGDMLLTLGRPEAAAEAYSRALALHPDEQGLVRARRGFALLSTGKHANLARAVADLRAGIAAEPDNYNAYRELSRAYGQLGEVGKAQLVMAEGNFRAGNTRQAKIFAARAQQRLQKGTPGWIRADDILNVGK
ncbi:MAG TPA: tetratricopeptide repeat protein, partial [Pararhizobium sp.]|nr:tetratricopeptide repeat protein [Pararhizobium sp.]